MTKPNVIVIYPDQLRAQSLPLFGEHQIETPHIDRLASEGLSIDNAISNYPFVLSRAMLVTGRYPQTTGHLINTTRTRHSEISIGDTFAHWGYKTGWVGNGIFIRGYGLRLIEYLGTRWAPEGRDRLGFDYWRAYNQHGLFHGLSKDAGITSVGTAMRPKDCSNMV